MKKTPPYQVEQIARNVLIVRMDLKAGDERWFLLGSDRHHDNQHSNHKMELKHLDQAVNRDAGIFDFGDLFCAMQGKWDRRADQNQLREELRGTDYLDLLVKYNSNFYAPYAENIIQISMGNHETGIQRHHQTNLSERLVERINGETRKVRVGTYAGWIGFRFTINGTKRSTVWLYYHHGYGGGGPVTRGTIQTNRMAVYLPDATFVYSGHTHDEFVLTIARDRITQQGITRLDEQVHIKAPGYKDEYTPSEGYHIEGGRPPKPMGANWLRFSVEPGDAKEGRVSYEVTRAK